MKNLILLLSVAALLYSFKSKQERETEPDVPPPVVVEEEPSVSIKPDASMDLREPEGANPYYTEEVEEESDTLGTIGNLEKIEVYADPFPLRGGEDWRVTYYSKTNGDGQDYVIVDGFDLKPQGTVPIAYFSAHYEAWRPDAKDFNLKGSRNLGRWAKEKYIKWYLPSNMEVMRERIQYAKSKGFVGIDWDNVDGPGGVDHFVWLAGETKKAGLYCGLKNAVEYLPLLDKKGVLHDLVDFVVSESRGRKEQVVYADYGLYGVHMSKGETTYSPLSRAVRGDRGNRYD